MTSATCAPPKVGSEVVPTFAIISMHSGAISQLLKESQNATGIVKVSLRRQTWWLSGCRLALLRLSS